MDQAEIIAVPRLRADGSPDVTLVMPSDQSTWLIAVPQDGDSEGLIQELSPKLQTQAKLPSRNVADLPIPSFKTGTLDTLLSLSEDLPKIDASFTATVAKTVDTLRSLLNNDPVKLAQHILVDEQPIDHYLLSGWKWNEGRYGINKSLHELVDTLNQEMSSIDSIMKAKLNNYNLVKGSLVQMQRKRTGNLSVRSLVDIVSKGDFVESEYMETILVAVQKPLVKTWNAKYERLTPYVVPRSARLLASDDEFSLFGVVIFRRVQDEFIQKCRENKYIVRDFVYSEDEAERQSAELENTAAGEKELWAELLRLSRVNFSESFQIFVHLKVIRLVVESVLRYGLPAQYSGIVIKPEPKVVKKVFNVLQTQFAYLKPRSNAPGAIKGMENTDFVGEYQSLLDQEYHDFVMYEVPWIVN